MRGKDTLCGKKNDTKPTNENVKSGGDKTKQELEEQSGKKIE